MGESDATRGLKVLILISFDMDGDKAKGEAMMRQKLRMVIKRVMRVVFQNINGEIRYRGTGRGQTAQQLHGWMLKQGVDEGSVDVGYMAGV